MSDHGAGYKFGPDVVERFCKKHSLDIIVRGNQCMHDGYKFFSTKDHPRRLVTLWSAAGYDQWDNAGAWMMIDEHLMTTFGVGSLSRTTSIGT